MIYPMHSAAACVAGHETQGNLIEVSWALLEDLDRRALMGIEVDPIAACRTSFGESPARQFHGRALKWQKLPRTAQYSRRVAVQA